MQLIKAFGAGADFVMFEYDLHYKTFERNFKKDFPMFTGYEIINFYKLPSNLHFLQGRIRIFP